LEREDVPCGPVHTYDTLFADPQVVHNALVREWPHSLLKTVRAAGSPLRFSGTPVEQHSAAPLLGEHTDSVLMKMGFTEQEIGGFREKGLV
jgi:crotonobetainyl-CoA:carnitine CoA-transferase CaiB-like acyl-CoA transferase